MSDFIFDRIYWVRLLSLFSGLFICFLIIVLWDVYGENTNYNVLAGHKNAVLQVKWNQVIPHQLVSCSADKTVAVWDGNKGQCIRKLIEHKSIVNSLDNARNDANLLVSGSDDSSALLWDARSKTSVATMKHQYQVTAVAMRSDGEAVYTGGIDNIIRRFDVRKLGKAVENLQLVGHSDTITGLCLSPDNNFLLSNAMDSSVRKWDVRPFVKQDSGRCVVGYAGAHHGAEKVLLKVNWSNSASSMGNKLVTAGSSDRIVHIWEEDTGKQLYYLPGHKGSVNEVCFHPTEAIVASCSTDKTIFLGELS